MISMSEESRRETRYIKKLWTPAIMRGPIHKTGPCCLVFSRRRNKRRLPTEKSGWTMSVRLSWTRTWRMLSFVAIPVTFLCVELMAIWSVLIWNNCSARTRSMLRIFAVLSIFFIHWSGRRLGRIPVMTCTGGSVGTAAWLFETIQRCFVEDGLN